MSAGFSGLLKLTKNFKLLSQILFKLIGPLSETDFVLFYGYLLVGQTGLGNEEVSVPSSPLSPPHNKNAAAPVGMINIIDHAALR
jgi:hypothetical protein